MNAILAFIPKPVLFWLAVTLLVLSVVNHFRIGNLQAENARYEAAVAQCVVTNGQNKTAISFFKLQNEQCLDERRADETKLANAVAAWNAEKQILQEQANDRAETIVEVYREPNCEDFAKINITDVCPAFVDGLRRRAESNNRVQD